MGQVDILDWLRERRLDKRTANRFYSAREIECAMVERGVSALNVRGQLNALYVYHYLDVKIDKPSARMAQYFMRRYRLKEDYVEVKV